MSLQKRKCEKGFEHTGRFIEAVCLQPSCASDRLLCFYCIHESHPNHSIAYLIPGLKSPLEMLNKNSRGSNPEKHMKYIEKRFNKINHGWLRISDNIQQGITRIEERMIPQFNVIRQTFKKNSVDQIIRELTSNEITSQRIEQYVEMINMVKKYKFNDIKKLKFMAFLIEHKLSRIFLNANDKIKEIMNGLIQQTNEMNFLNFSVEELIKDRALYLEISKNLNFYQIKDIQLNTSSFQKIYEQKISQVMSPAILIEQSEDDSISLQEDKHLSQIIIEGKQVKISANYQSNQIIKERQVERVQKEQKNQISIQHQHNLVSLIEEQALHVDQKEAQAILSQKSEEIDQKQSQNYSNGFRSCNYAVQLEYSFESSQKCNYIQANHKQAEGSFESSQKFNHKQAEEPFESSQKSNHKQAEEPFESSQKCYHKQSEEPFGSSQTYNHNKDFKKYKKSQRNNFQNCPEKPQQPGPLILRQQTYDNQKDKEEAVKVEQVHIIESLSKLQNYRILEEKQMKEYEVHMNQFEYESYEHPYQSFNSSYMANYQLNDHKQNSFNQNFNQQRLQQKSRINENQNLNYDLQKAQFQQNICRQSQSFPMQENYLGENSHISIHSERQISNPNYNNNIQKSPFKELSEFSCQFPSIDGERQISQNDSQPDQRYDSILYESQTEDQLIRPSYQFSLIISRNQMTLSNKIDFTHQRDFIDNASTSAEKNQFFDENNQFEDIFGLKSQDKDFQKSKKFELFKKYFIFYNEEASEESSQQLSANPPKRAKWAEEHLKEKDNILEKNIKKKVKISDLESSDDEIINIFLPRTRSQKIKLMKMLEETQKQDKPQSVLKSSSKHKKDKKVIRKTYNDNDQTENEISQEDQKNKSNARTEQKNQSSIIHQQENEDGSWNSPKLQMKNYPELIQNLDEENNFNKQFELLQNITQENFQSDQSNSNYANFHRNMRKDINLSDLHEKMKKKKIQKSDEQKYSSKQQPPKAPFSYPHSVKLDKNAIAEVSNSLLNKYEMAFLREENIRKKQNNDGIHQNKIRIKTVYLNGRFHEQIKKRLSLIDEDFVEQLTIFCDTMDCAVNEDSVSLICKMNKLKKLCIYWAYKLPKVLTKRLISSLPLLEELVLCEFQDLDTEIASQIVSKLPNLKRLHYASDYIRNLDKMQENLQFLIDFVGTQTKLSPLSTLSKLKSLQTFWLYDIDDVKQVRQIISRIKTLKEISISAFEKRNKDLSSLFPVLSKRNTLTCLCLQGLYFKEESLVAIVRNNPNLNTLIINECPTVSNNTLSAVADTCKQLQQLFLMLTDSLQGQRIFELKKLRTLVVRACWSINVTKFREGIRKLKNLRYLSLNMNNYWLGDDMLPSIAELPNLTFLNLDTTKVTDKGMLHLTGLKNLNTLICGRTEITAQGLYKFLQKTKSTIKKLGLNRESNQELNRPEKINKHDVIYTKFQGKYLIKIGQLLPELTHLSIGGFKNLYIQNFATLDNLKCLLYKLQSLPEQTEKFLQNITKLNLNANY